MTRPALADYLALLKLRIAALLLLVAASGYLVTSGPAVQPVPFLLLMASGLLASAGASAVNHWADRDLDPVMVRTRDRPIPQGRVPAVHALVLGVGLLAAAMALALLVNVLTALFIVLGFVVYVFVYTLGLKRRSVWNIVIGGFSGSCPALAGSAAAANAVGLGPALIALLVFLWTPGHFWVLAYRTRDDYRRVGIPMLPAVLDERSTVRAIAGSTALVPVATFAFLLTPSFGLAFLGVAAVAGAVLLLRTARFIRRPSMETALDGYKFSGLYLTLILAGAMLDAVLAIRILP